MKRLWIASVCLVIFLIPIPTLRAEEGLLVHYGFQEGSGSVLRDSSGGGHDGRIEGDAKWVKDLPFPALDFNGTNAHLIGPTDLPIDRVGTVEVWCYPRVVGGGLISWHLGTQWVDQRLVMGFSTHGGNNVTGAVSDGKLVNTVQEPVPNMLNRWSHLVMRFDERNIQFFLNGKLWISKPRFVNPDIKGVPMRIGVVEGLGARYFNGMIAEAKVYNRALSAREIAVHYAEQATVFQPESNKPESPGVADTQAAQKQPGKSEQANTPRTEPGQEPPRRLETAERMEVVRDGGYFPTLIRLHNGTLAAVVRGGIGARHMGPGGRLDLITSGDGGKTWSEPRVIVYMPPDTRSGSFGQAEDGRLILAFNVTGPYRGRQFVFETERYTPWVTTSDDLGDTWTPPQQIKTDPYQYAMPYGKMVCLPDGTLLMALYGWYQPEHEGGELPQDKKGYFAAVSRSEDNGTTWSPPIPIIADTTGRRENTNYNEVGLAVLPGNRVLAVMRGGPQDGVDQCISSDGGRTWGPIQSIIKGLSRQPADVILLKSGRLLLTFGKRGTPPFGVEAVLSHNVPGQWDELAVPAENPRPAVPSTTGTQWDWRTHVALEWNAANEDCGYPSSVQLDDGTIVTMYYGVGYMDKPEDVSKSGHGGMEYARCVRYQEADLAASGATDQE